MNSPGDIQSNYGPGYIKDLHFFDIMKRLCCRYREIMAAKNFIPEQLKDKREVKSMPESRKLVDSEGQKKAANRFADATKISLQKNKM